MSKPGRYFRYGPYVVCLQVDDEGKERLSVPLRRHTGPLDPQLPRERTAGYAPLPKRLRRAVAAEALR